MDKNVAKRIKQGYLRFADKIYSKRHKSPFAQRRYVHGKIYDSFLKHVEPGMLIADVGAGEGALAILMAKKGARVVAFELSEPNIKAGQNLAAELGVADLVRFVLADAENLPSKSNKFDLVVSSHVLEHLPDFSKGLKELRRIAKRQVIFAVPTCLNWCAILLLGGGNYWQFNLFSPWHFAKGFIRVVINLLSEGVDEKYAGTDLPHVWRYPWIVIKKIRRAKLRIIRSEASTLAPPYLLTYFPFLQKSYEAVDQLTELPILKYLGYGTTFVARKEH